MSIIIPCRNERGHIEMCLSSTLSQLPPTGGFEVIVADGMSDDGTRALIERIAMAGSAPIQESLDTGQNRPPYRQPYAGLPSSALKGEREVLVATVESRLGNSALRHLESAPSGAVPRPGLEAEQGEVLTAFNCPPKERYFPIVRVIDNPGRIVSKGLNAAIRAARGDIIVRMDAHTEYAPDYVRQCVAVLHATGADNVGGPARTKAHTCMAKAVAAAYHSPFSVGGARFHDPAYEGYVDTVTYGCWPKSAFERFGLFDEELVRNQDDEHNLRIIRGGGKVYQSPTIKSWYRPRGTLGALFQQYMQYGYWKLRVIQKHKLPASWRHLVPGTFVLGLIALSLFSFFCLLAAGASPLFKNLNLLSTCLLSALLGLYGASVLAASVITAAKTEWRLLPILPLVFPSYHFGYGCGFLRAVWDFVICRNAHAVWAGRLTRK